MFLTKYIFYLDLFIVKQGILLNITIYKFWIKWFRFYFIAVYNGQFAVTIRLNAFFILSYYSYYVMHNYDQLEHFELLKIY